MSLSAALSDKDTAILNGDRGYSSPLGVNAKDMLVGDRLNELALLASTSAGEGSTLVGYDNSDSGLTATTVKEAIDEVAGGAVTPAAEDVVFTPAGSIAATDVQAALEEVDADVTAAQADATQGIADAAAAQADADTANTALGRIKSGSVVIGLGNTQQATADLGLGDISAKKAIASQGQSVPDATAIRFWAIGQADGTLVVYTNAAATAAVEVNYWLDAR